MGMKVLTLEEKIVKSVTKNKELGSDCIVALEELYKLAEYYANEVKQRKSLVKKLKDDDMRFAHEQGKITAYTDHIEEISFIIEVLSGKKRA